MNTKLLGRRIENIEQRVCPKHDGVYTLEELVQDYVAGGPSFSKANRHQLASK